MALSLVWNKFGGESIGDLEDILSSDHILAGVSVKELEDHLDLAIQWLDNEEKAAELSAMIFPDAREPFVNVISFVVQLKYRRRGIMTRLYSSVDWFRQRGFHHIYFHAATDQGVYQQTGINVAKDNAATIRNIHEGSTQIEEFANWKAGEAERPDWYGETDGD